MKLTALGTWIGICLLSGPVLAQTQGASPENTPRGTTEQKEHGATEKTEKKEKEITLDQVPAAARATIEKESRGKTITKVEQADKDGKTIYEAELKGADNSTSEVEVSADGKVLEHNEGKEHEGKENGH